MNVCIINCGKDRNMNRLEEVSKGLSRGLESQGHMVTILNAYTDNDKRLSYYDFIIVGTESVGLLSAKTPEVLAKFLREVPGAAGKRSFVFNLKSPRCARQLCFAMKDMEREGMFVTNSGTLKNASEAEAVGKRLQINRN